MSQPKKYKKRKNGSNPNNSTVDTTVPPQDLKSEGVSSNSSEQNATIQEKTSFFVGLMSKIGYIKKDKVSKLSNHLEKMFAKGEEGKSVVPEDIKKKFEVIRKNINELLTGGVIVKLGYVNSKAVSSLYGNAYKIVNELLKENLTAEPTDGESMSNDQFDRQPIEKKLEILKERINALIERLKVEASQGGTGAPSQGETSSEGNNPATGTDGLDGGANEVTDNGSTQENDSGFSQNETDLTGEFSGDGSGSVEDASGDENPDGDDNTTGETGDGDAASSEEPGKPDETKEGKKNGSGDEEDAENPDLNSEVEKLCQKLEEQLIDVELKNLKNQSIENRIEQIISKIDELKRQLKEKPTEEDLKLLRKENDKLYDSLDKYEKIKAAIDDKLFVKKELESLEQYEEEIKKLTEEINKDKSELQELKTEYPKLQLKCQGLEKSNREIVASKAKLQEDYKQCLADVQELKGSDVGILKETIREKDSEIGELTSAKEAVDANLKSLQEAKASVDLQLVQTKDDLANANGTIREKDDELRAKSAEIRNNEKIIKEKEKEIGKLTKQSKIDNDKIKEQEESLEAKQKTINEKETEIGQLKTANSNLDGQVNSLTTKVDNLEKDKVKLTKDKEAERKKTQEKVDFINAERDAFAKAIMTLAESLSKASGLDFLGCCDDAFESNRVSLQEKVAKPIRAFVRELVDIDPKKYASQKALENAYYALVKENLDSTSGLTRIAQWYAYSCIPFMVDEDRSDGLFVRQAEIRNMYSLATKLLGMVGVEYRMPILFAERMSDDNIYDDVTGKRQLNIEYMCPTARSHKENIDCVDNSSVIIDVVEVGYCDNRGNNKNPQVII